MWLRIVWARRSASTSAVDRLADRGPRRGACRDGRSARRPAAACPSTVKSDARRPAVAELAAVADLAAALGVERRPVEDDLGLGAGLGAQLDLGRASSSSYSMPSRRIATTRRLGASVVS